MATSKQPHPLADMLLTVVLPSIVLEWASKPKNCCKKW